MTDKTTNVISKKITGFTVKKPEEAQAQEAQAPKAAPPPWKRPASLPASVYKISKCHNTPDAAVYVTISDTEICGELVPAEIFINSQDVTHQQWMAALTRIISAMFRQGGDCSFIAEELLQIHDPKGGCFQNGRFHPSLVSQVGLILKDHLELLAQRSVGKRPLVESLQDYFEPEQVASLEEEDPTFPPNATLCPKCRYKAVVVLDGCQTCLSCGDSKCG